MKFVVKKLITLMITLFVISFLTFTAFSVLPGDAAVTKLGTGATEEQIEALRLQMGLKDPLTVRYERWLKGALRGEFGDSYRYDGVSVSSLLADRLPVTALLSAIAFLMILICSVPLGLASARYSGRWADVMTSQLTQIVMAVPPFFLGILITYLFGLILRWFQPGNFIAPSQSLVQSVKYLIFPALAVALPKIAMVVKFLRNSVLSEMKKDYVRTAYSRGNSENGVLYGHVLKNAMIPVVTFFAMVVAEILAGSIVVEQVFSVPGVGRLLITSIQSRDYPVVSAIILYVTTVVVVLNFAVDLLYQFLDPRVKNS